MATFTTVSKQPLSWPSVPVATASETYFLKISDDYFLLIGDTYKLIINNGGARTPTAWTKIAKSQ